MFLTADEALTINSNRETGGDEQAQPLISYL